MHVPHQSKAFNLSTSPAIGREEEVEWAKRELANPDVRVVAFVAPGGVGKSEIVKNLRREWEQLQKQHGHTALVEWSFYSQGSTERVVSAESFFVHAFETLGISTDRYAQLPPAARGQLLADLAKEKKILFILDGLEPLQYGAGPLRGALKDSGISTFLSELLSTADAKSNVLITTRVALSTLTHRALSSKDVELLRPEASHKLLGDLGVKGEPETLRALAAAVKHHALSLMLIGRYLASQEGEKGNAGRFLDAFQNRQIPRAISERISAGNHGANAFAVLQFIMQDHSLATEFSALRLMGLFDRPEDISALEALRTIPDIAGAEVAGLPPQTWESVLTKLRSLGLLAPVHPAHPTVIDAHPLIREFFAEQFAAQDPAAWKLACRTLGTHFEKLCPHPAETNTAEGFGLAFQAVRYYALAEDAEKAIALLDRAWNADDKDRAKQFRGTRQHGLYGLELVALAGLFEQPFAKLYSWVPAAQHPRLLSEAGIRLRNVGRLNDSRDAHLAAKRLVDDGVAKPSRGFFQGNCGLIDMHAALGDLMEARRCGISAMDRTTLLENALRREDPTAAPVTQRVLALSRLAEVTLFAFRAGNDKRDLEIAEGLLAIALEISETNNDSQVLESQALYTFALLAAETKDYPQFWRLHDRLKRDRPEPPSLLGRAIRRLACATVLQSEGEQSADELRSALLTRAEDQLREALPLLQQAGYVDYTVPGLIALGRNAKTRGDTAAQRGFFARAAQLATQAGMQLYLREIARLDRSDRPA